jgi:DNA-directed RNA polymerase subunit RPC12/RpoP
MSEIRSFFRHCPGCGRRFHIKLVSKDKVKVGETETRRSAEVVPPNQLSGFTAPVPVLLEEGTPMMVEIDEYRYHYKCKHCGHEWTEVHDEEKPE